MPAHDDAPHERILRAALDGFARDGVGATSVRDVAKEAGVSPGLVQHYFPSKAALRAAVDGHVTSVVRAALQTPAAQDDVVADLSERLTRLVADHFVALKYLARGVAEGDAAALVIFDTLTQLCRDQLATLSDQGVVRDDLDLEWAALHTIVINLGTVLLEPGVSRQLGRPFLGPRQVKRWKDATTKLFVAGEFRSGRENEAAAGRENEAAAGRENEAAAGRENEALPGRAAGRVRR